MFFQVSHRVLGNNPYIESSRFFYLVLAAVYQFWFNKNDMI